jgi:uncharacterized protein YcbK (DUF882 family)
MLIRWRKSDSWKPTLGDHFDASEFECPCGCELQRIEDRLIIRLEQLHKNLETRYPSQKVAIHINSGYRCISHNQKVGGKPDSQHLIGNAADIVCKVDNKLCIEEALKFIEGLGFMGIGKYDTFTHVDVRRDKARWDERSKK